MKIKEKHEKKDKRVANKEKKTDNSLNAEIVSLDPEQDKISLTLFSKIQTLYLLL